MAVKLRPSESPAQSAPAQEPVALLLLRRAQPIIERLALEGDYGNTVAEDLRDDIRRAFPHLQRACAAEKCQLWFPDDGPDCPNKSRKDCALYAAPQPDEARELLREVVDHIFGCGSAVKRIRAFLEGKK